MVSWPHRPPFRSDPPAGLTRGDNQYLYYGALGAPKAKCSMLLSEHTSEQLVRYRRKLTTKDGTNQLSAAPGSAHDFLDRHAFVDEPTNDGVCLFPRRYPSYCSRPAAVRSLGLTVAVSIAMRTCRIDLRTDGAVHRDDGHPTDGHSNCWYFRYLLADPDQAVCHPNVCIDSLRKSLSDALPVHPYHARQPYILSEFGSGMPEERLGCDFR